MSWGARVPTLGAPGIHFVPPEPVRRLVRVRRDITAFAGVAPRGAVRRRRPELEPELAADVDVATWLATSPVHRSVPVRVTSWDEYRQQFGGFEGPGRLPYAVSAFFAGGGQEADIIRIVHDYGSDAVASAAGRASGTLPAPLTVDGSAVVVHARDEGSWGNRLAVGLSFAVTPLPFWSATASALVVDPGAWVPGGSLLRLTHVGGVQELRYVDRSWVREPPGGTMRERVLDLAVAAVATPIAAELVTGVLEIVDRDPGWPRRERIERIGLRSDHPRWLARTMILESELVWPDDAWVAGAVDLAGVGPSLPAFAVDAMSGGVDRWPDIVPEDFWDAGWVPGDEDPGSGVHCLAGDEEIGLLVAPDLYEPAALPERVDVTDPVTLCGPDFAPHVDVGPPPAPTPRPPGLDGLALDPTIPSDLVRIVTNQQVLVAFAAWTRAITVLLDVPPGLSHHQVLRWRVNFDSEHAASYHPWLDVAAPDDDRDSLVRVNPSAFAAGIVAERELRLGVQHGPANQLAAGAVRVADEITGSHHDELHLAGVNVFRTERDGIRLTGARTLAQRPILRQLSVARLLAVLRLTLEREMRWAVFEPNGPALWAEVRRAVHGLLSRLFDAGAFQGATTKEAFFVRCDRTTMTQYDLDNGRLICLVGVAPAEPVEYLVLQLALSADTGVTVSVAG